MNRLTNRNIIILITCLFWIPILASAQAPKIEKVPPTYIPAESGAQMYKQYCAACHGIAGKGDGPAAAALKTAPTSLATLESRHNGKFPNDYVINLLQNGAPAPSAHGSAEMPIWGPILGSMIGAREDKRSPVVLLRIYNLTKHLQSLQSK